MNTTHDNHDSQAKIAATDFGGRDNLTTVETPATLRRPNPYGDENIPNGSATRQGRRKETPYPNARHSRGASISVSAHRLRKTGGQTTRKKLVRTAVVEAMDSVLSDGEASYLAAVKFDHETDLSFKVGGILVSIGPAPGTDWDEGTPVKAGTVLAELKQADFTNALNSARAKRNWRARRSNVFASCARRMPFPSRNSMLLKRTGERRRPNWTRRSRIFGIRGWWRPSMEWC